MTHGIGRIPRTNSCEFMVCGCAPSGGTTSRYRRTLRWKYQPAHRLNCVGRIYCELISERVSFEIRNGAVMMHRSTFA
jgi:hypothetical protein